MIDKLTTTYKNNLLGTALGVAAGYYLAKKLGYDKQIIVISFMLVGSLSGANLESYAKAKRGVPTASLVK